MLRIIKQIVRGCTTLPHVGEHPGTVMVLFLILATGAAGIAKGGLFGFLLMTGVAILFYGPMYLAGAYSRAMDSDKIEKNKNAKI